MSDENKKVDEEKETADNPVTAEPLVVIKEELEKVKQQSEERLNGWKRAQADLINYQKDEGKRFEEAIKFAQYEFMKDAVSVSDSFNLALLSLEKNSAPEVVRGVQLIRSQYEAVLKKYGLNKIEIKSGDKFNPVFGESVGEMESDLPDGSVAEVVDSGYTYFERVVRPARVKLAVARDSKQQAPNSK